MFDQNVSGLRRLVLLFALVSIPASTLFLPVVEMAVAQSGPALAVSTLPSVLPSDKIVQDGVVRIDGSKDMTTINRLLKQRYEETYPDVDVALEANGTEAALKALLNSEIDLAAIGRALTTEEKVKGLVEIPISTEKVAIIVGNNNPFTGSLTLEQLSKIFQGEIVNWAEVGGPDVPIRVIDRPEPSETRLAFRQYGWLETVRTIPRRTNFVRLTSDDTAEVIRALGTDGIGYAIADQVREDAEVRLVQIAVLQDILPDSALYPYTFSRSYAYKTELAPALQSFLGFATTDPGQQAIVSAKRNDAQAIAAALATGAAALAAKQVTLPRSAISERPISEQPVPAASEPKIDISKTVEPAKKTVVEAIESAQTKVAAVAADTKAAIDEATQPLKDKAAATARLTETKLETIARDTEETLEEATQALKQQVAEATQTLKTTAPAVEKTKPIPAIPLIKKDDRTATEQPPEAKLRQAAEPQSEPAVIAAAKAPAQQVIKPVPTGRVTQPELNQQYFDLDTPKAPVVVEKPVREESIPRTGSPEPARVVERIDEQRQAVEKVAPPVAPVEPIAPEETAQLPGDEPVAATRKRRGFAWWLLLPLALIAFLIRQFRGKGRPAASVAQPKAPAATTTIPPAEPTKPQPPAAPAVADRPAPAATEDIEPQTLYERGIALSEAGHYAEAIPFFEEAVKLKPDFVAAWVGQGTVLLGLSRPDQALASFDRALEIDPNWLVAWVGKGKAFIQLDRVDDAQASFNQAAAINPDDASLIQALASLSPVKAPAERIMPDIEPSIITAEAASTVTEAPIEVPADTPAAVVPSIETPIEVSGSELSEESIETLERSASEPADAQASALIDESIEIISDASVSETISETIEVLEVSEAAPAEPAAVETVEIQPDAPSSAAADVVETVVDAVVEPAVSEPMAAAANAVTDFELAEAEASAVAEGSPVERVDTVAGAAKILEGEVTETSTETASEAIAAVPITLALSNGVAEPPAPAPVTPEPPIETAAFLPSVLTPVPVDDSQPTVETFKQTFQDYLRSYLGTSLEAATPQQQYMALAYVIRDRLMKLNRPEVYLQQPDVRIVGEIAAEFMPGPHLANNLVNLGYLEQVRQAMRELGLNLDELVEQEEEPGLGKGGLGRLMVCYLDSLSTAEVPAIGYGIRYEFGIFDQKIEDGWQVEVPDSWLRNGNPWELEVPEAIVEVKFGGETQAYLDDQGQYRVRWVPAEVVTGIPYDTPILGYRTSTINPLRLWKADSENLCKVLYPVDVEMQGKELRLKQQFFLVSCALQDALRLHRLGGGSPETLHQRFALQLNDTDPTLAVAELMRLLVDEAGLSWDQAWQVTQQTLSYTNHSLMPETLDDLWSVAVFSRFLPRHLEIIFEINYRFLEEVREKYPDDPDRLQRVSLVDETGERYVRTTHLACVGSHAVNGVSKLHTQLLEQTVLRDFYELYPEKFSNKTNGMTPRRFLLLINPRLANLITSEIGDRWITDLEELKKLEGFVDDPQFRREWRQVKQACKADLSDYIQQQTGIHVDVNSLFDIHTMRLHEYMRKHLQVLHILTLYNRIKANPEIDLTPRTFIFAGKAAPDYFTAKLIIKLIHAVADVVNNDPDVRGRLKVVFLPDYNLKIAQRIYPAADLAEYISTAGTEACSTGNMIFAMNGATIIGTLDGSNIELREAIGADNFFSFGLTAPEAETLRANGYSPIDYYHANPDLKAAIDLIASGFLANGDTELFRPLVDLLLYSDFYLLLADYQSYIDCQNRVSQAYRTPDPWLRMSILNTARIGLFSSDRAVREYCQDIWQVRSVSGNLREYTKPQAG